VRFSWRVWLLGVGLCDRVRSRWRFPPPGRSRDGPEGVSGRAYGGVQSCRGSGIPRGGLSTVLTGDQWNEVAPRGSTSREFRTAAPGVESGATQPVLADVAASVLPAEPPRVCGRLVRDGGMTAVHPDGGFRFWGDIKEQRVGGAKPMDIRAFVGAGGVVFRAWVSPGDDLVSAFRFDLGSTQADVPLDGATRGGGWIEWTPSAQLLHALASGTPRSVLVRTPSEDAWLEIRDEGRPLRDAARCAFELGVVASDG
jgi:hypothetical protein